jgi:hypothetical protein
LVPAHEDGRIAKKKQVYSVPALTVDREMAAIAGSDAGTGTLLPLIVPSPNCPALLSPQQ